MGKDDETDDETDTLLGSSFRGGIAGGFSLPAGWRPTHQSNGTVTLTDGSDIEVRVNTRRHRKGRLPKIFFKGKVQSALTWRPLSFEPYNISWWVAWISFLAATGWLISSILEFWDKDSDKVIDILDFVCALIFVLSAYLQLLEALNEEDVAFEDTFLVSNSDDLLGSSYPRQSAYRRDQNWKWFGFRWTRIGQYAANFDFFGAGLYAFGTFFALVTRESFLHFALVGLGKISGSFLFVAASIMLMVEVQDRWCVPQFDTIAWYASFFNFIGAFAFFIESIFDALERSDDNLGATFGFIGSIGFFICSCMLIVEVANKH